MKQVSSFASRACSFAAVKSPTKCLVSGACWFDESLLQANSTLPAMIADFVNDRYAFNGVAKAFSSLFTFTRSTTKTYIDAQGVVQTAAINSRAITHDPVSFEPLGISLEDAATNLQIRSNEDPVTGGYTELNSTTSATVSSTPINGINAPHHIHNSTNALHYIRPSRYLGVETNYSYVAGETYTFSGLIFSSDSSVLHTLFFEKPDGTVFSSWASDQMLLNLATGEVTGTQAGDVSVQDFGGGWFRYSVTKTADASGSARVHPILYLNDYGNSVGDDVAYIKLIGVQTEEGAVATSYIPTAGAAVTRAKDDCEITGVNFSDWYDAAKGTFYLDFVLGTYDKSQNICTIDDGTNANFILAASASNALGSNKTEGFITTASVTQFQAAITQGNLSGERRKLSLAYELNNSVFAYDGLVGTTDVTVAVPTVNKLVLGDRSDGLRAINGVIRELRYYDIRVTNGESQRITAAQGIIMDWKIYYDDDSTFTDADGTPFEAPRIGVQFIVQKLEHNKKYLILSGADYYTYQDEFGWWSCTELDMFDHLFTAGSNQLFVKGKMIGYDTHNKQILRVHADIKALGGVKDSWRHMPSQQHPLHAEILEAN